MLAILYWLVFSAGGCMAVRLLLPEKSPIVRVWLGLTLGLALEMWLPALCAFFLRFSLAAHWAALGLLALLLLGAFLGRGKKRAAVWQKSDTRLVILLLSVALPLTIIGGYLQWTHNLNPVNGSLHVGQSTYGDLPLHLSIASGLRNAAFPPDYPILPGALLSYPFLTDTLSTSFMLLGFDLRWAILFPGLLMTALTFSGYVLFAARMADKKAGAVLAALFFFLNGGLGFLYLVDMQGKVLGSSGSNELQSAAGLWERVKLVLNGWYQTPANHAEFTTYNLRWSNVIVDMMVPQRTTLGGWTQVIPCIYLLCDAIRPSSLQGPALPKDGPTAVFQKRSVSLRQMILLGVWAGMLPMVNTHCFLALGLMSLGWLLHDFSGVRDIRLPWTLTAWLAVASAACLLFSGVAEGAGAAVLRWMGISAAIGAVGCGIWTIVQAVLRRRSAWPELWPRLANWGVYGALAVALAAPQLFTWTFRQSVGNEQFLRFRFNWVNGEQGMLDGYLWFYVKNIGLPFLLILIALLEKNEKRRFLAAGAFMIFLPAELIQFQPNVYDNNKLFYIWYMLCAVIAADYGVELLGRFKGLPAKIAVGALAGVLCFSTGALAIAREWVSDYQMFSRAEVAAAQRVEKETAQDAVFLTGDQHINFVSSLAGRRIVCGPDLWLYWHGLNSIAAERHADVRRFYANPAGNRGVLEKYGVDYILVSGHERYDYTVDEETLDREFQLLFEQNGIKIYAADAAPGG